MAINQMNAFYAADSRLQVSPQVFVGLIISDEERTSFIRGLRARGNHFRGEEHTKFMEKAINRAGNFGIEQ